MTKLKNTVNLDEAINGIRKLADNSVDITVTSPPYNKRRNTYGWLVQTDVYSTYKDKMPEKEYQEWQLNVLNETFCKTKAGGSMFYNHKIRWQDGLLIHPMSWISQSKWAIRQEIVWDRIIAANVRGWRFWQVEERIYWLYKPIDSHLVGKELESRHAKMSSIWRMRPVQLSKAHPAPFPLELPTRAIYSMVGENKKLILDPFCGSGTTLVAAKLLGHDYIGFDIDQNYIDYSIQRLSSSDSEKEVVEEEITKHIVKKSYKERKESGASWRFAPEHVKASSNGIKSNNKKNKP